VTALPVPCGQQGRACEKGWTSTLHPEPHLDERKERKKYLSDGCSA